MRLLVFIKQVPDPTEIKFDPERKTIVREGVKNTINAYDRRAISEAVRYRNEEGGEVIVATMGPPQAREALEEALAMGADRAIHIEDRKLAGSDTLATARVIAAAAKKIGFDLILFGQHSTDSETGQVPPEVAELLDIPCAVAVRKMEYLDSSIRVWSETDEGTSILELPLPAVISAAERLIKPIKVKDQPAIPDVTNRVEAWSASDLRLDDASTGLKGSPTWVADIYEVAIQRQPKMLDQDLESAARAVLSILREEAKEHQPSQSVPENLSGGEAEYWCFIERYQNQIRSVSLEILNTAAWLAQKKNGRVCAIHIGSKLTQKEIALLSSHGADAIYECRSTKDPHPDGDVELLTSQLVLLKPFAFLLPASSYGKYLAPRIAARLGLGLTGDCVGLHFDENLRLVQLKPAFGGNYVAPIYSRTDPQMATIRPGALEAWQPRAAGEIPLMQWESLSNIPHKFKIISREIDPGIEATRMEDSEIVVCVGMGLGQENISLVRELAGFLHAGIGATRRVVDTGWMQRQFQVGLTGKFIAPAAYLGLGVSGRYNHTIGIRKAHKIIAVNNDPAAEIFKNCDFGVVTDCRAFAEVMLNLLSREASR